MQYTSSRLGCRFPCGCGCASPSVEIVGGDIVPVSSIARTLSILEGVTGPLYLAVLIGRLVGLRWEYEGSEAPKDDAQGAQPSARPSSAKPTESQAWTKG